MRWSVWAKCVAEDLCLAVEEGAAGALEYEGDEVLGVGAIEIDLLGVTVRDKNGDEEMEDEEAPGVGASEIDALGVTARVGAGAGEGAGAVEMN